MRDGINLAGLVRHSELIRFARQWMKERKDEGYQAVAFEVGASLEAALKENAELKLVLASVRSECDNLRERQARLINEQAELRDLAYNRAPKIMGEEANKKLAEVEARAEALRAALEKIAEWDCLATQAKTGITLMSQVGLIRATAQAALSPLEANPNSPPIT